MPVMSQSPPKRMTRARAKAVEETKKTTKILTPAAKAAKTTKRKLPADEEVQDQVESNATSSATRVVPKSRATTKSAVAKTVKKAEDNDESKDATTRTRTRTRNEVTKLREPSDAPLKITMTTKAPVRKTRARPPTTSQTVEPAKSMSKKKVTFQDDSDKENVILSASAGKKKLISSDVQKAKSLTPSVLVSKSSRTTAAKAPASKQIKTDKISKEQSKLPLSPRKDKQVAKADLSGEDEDEQIHLKSTTESAPALLLMSPVKMQSSPIRPTSGHDITLMSNDMFEIDELELPGPSSVSPRKAHASGLASSPAKRPAPSPFKESMKSSPRKLILDNALPMGSVTVSTFKDSLMSKSPQKFNLDLGPSKASFANQDTEAFNQSLFQSPARRPPSPIKDFGQTFIIHTPSADKKKAAPGSSAIQQSARRFRLSPTKNLTCSLKAARSPEASVKVHKMTPERQADLGGLDKVLAISISSEASQDERIRQNEQQELEVISASMDVQVASNMAELPSTTPPWLPNTQARSHFTFRSPNTQWSSEDDSEDELQATDTLYNDTPSMAHRRGPLRTPAQLIQPTKDSGSTSKASMTILAERFGAWTGASPDKKVMNQRKAERSVFSPIKPIPRTSEGVHLSSLPVQSTIEPSLFNEAMDIHEDVIDSDVTMTEANVEYGPADTEESFRQSQASEASQEYGDENAIPIDPALFETRARHNATYTPQKLSTQHPHVIHTVSKVPLRAAASNDPSMTDRPQVKRSRSLSSALTPRADLELQLWRQFHPQSIAEYDTPGGQNTLRKAADLEGTLGGPGTPLAKVFAVKVSTPNGANIGQWSAAAIPARTPRPGLNCRLLSGAVVFVDVFTSEGADASGIFIELLTQMGAKCVKTWNWNPRSSVGHEDATCEGGDGTHTKVGITHVVFKDGGKRTMEKVRDARGVVSCVGVGWVLDCERENNWLQETEYTVDHATIPRGGHRRRKSMEPRALANSYGTISTSNSPAKLSPPDMSPTKQYLNLSPPSLRKDIIAVPDTERRFAMAPVGGALVLDQFPITPLKLDKETFEDANTPHFYDGFDSMAGSPTTPYFLHSKQLTQQTCPPKQTQELFFPVSGRIEDQPDASLRHRLLLARRKSLQWAPKIGSPLAERI